MYSIINVSLFVKPAMYKTNMKDLAASRSTFDHQLANQQPGRAQDDLSPNDYEYTRTQILYSYWWCFWHVCLRCVRRVRLTPATRDELSFHPEVLSPGQLGGRLYDICRYNNNSFTIF